jgi:hypothetical protein
MPNLQFWPILHLKYPTHLYHVPFRTKLWYLQMAYEGEIAHLCTITFRDKVDFLIISKNVWIFEEPNQYFKNGPEQNVKFIGQRVVIQYVVFQIFVISSPLYFLYNSSFTSCFQFCWPIFVPANHHQKKVSKYLPSCNYDHIMKKPSIVHNSEFQST